MTLIDRFIVDDAEPGTVEYAKEIAHRYVGRMRSKKNKGYALSYLTYIEAGRNDTETLIPLYEVAPRTAYKIRTVLRRYKEMLNEVTRDV